MQFTSKTKFAQDQEQTYQLHATLRTDKINSEHRV